MADRILAVIFDMDGLLVDTEPCWTQAEISTFSAVGVSLTEKMTEETRGLRTDAVVRHWYNRYPWPQLDASEIESALIMEVERCLTDNVVLMPGARILTDLLSRKGYPLAIASSSPLRIIHAVLTAVNLNDKFPVQCSTEHEQYGKPAPHVYLSVAKRLGIPPHQCLAFEDSLNGIRAASQAGMFCIGVNRDPQANLKHECDLFFQSLEDVDERVLADIL